MYGISLDTFLAIFLSFLYIAVYMTADTHASEFDDSALSGDDGISIESLQEALRVCEEERKEYLDGWKRAKADAVNERKRQQERSGAERQALLAGHVLVLLPIFDSLRAALQEQDASAQEGIERVFAQCLRAFSDLDVTILDPIGEPFDPHCHESVGEQVVDTADKVGMVVAVMRVGAMTGDAVIRAASVYVGVSGDSGLEKNDG